jgi:predicted dehydrogenase
MMKPSLAVVGLGKYYEKLRPWIDQVFRLTHALDRCEDTSTPDHLRTLLQVEPPDAIMLLTPNGLHAAQIDALACLSVPTLVEKPIATRLSGLEDVVGSLDFNRRLYCSDFYWDVRALPLRLWLGETIPWAEQLVEVNGDRGLWDAGIAALGDILSVDAVILEGSGGAGSFDERPWLWDPVDGGVIWDLAYHLVVMAYNIFGGPITVGSCQRQTLPRGVLGGAETHARASLGLPGGIPFKFEVGKYEALGNRRWFRLQGDQGEAGMVFGRPNSLIVRAGGRMAEGVLKANDRELVCKRFRAFVDDETATAYGFEAAVAATETLIEARDRAPIDLLPF